MLYYNRLITFIFVLSIEHALAFLTTSRCVIRCERDRVHQSLIKSKSDDFEPRKKWTHADIEWRLSPSPDVSFLDKIKIKAAAKAIRAELIFKNQPIPPILCPKGKKAELEGFKDGIKIAKFGFTTNRGPSSPEIDETIQDLYGQTSFPGIGAIIYMYVEPEYRKCGIGELALEAIYAIQTVQNIDFIVLVANDDGSGKLISWYEKNGFSRAPKLQDSFGSPGEKYGVTMIRPTEVASDIFARCKIKWW